MASGQQARLQAFPPMVVHREQRVAPKDVQPMLATYLKRSTKKPFLHPDAWLGSEGVRFGPRGGATGGWAIHHLRRIEAGLRGESLMPESNADLVAKFGDDATQHGVRSSDPNLPGDDSNLDQTITENAHHGDEAAPPRSGRELTQAEKKARKEEKKKRQREEQQSGERERKRKKKNEDIGAWAEATSDAEHSAAPSGNQTPYADSMTAHGEYQEADEFDAVAAADLQSKEEYEKEQEIVEGEVGQRGVPISKHNGSVPVIATHDASGEVEVPAKPKTAEEKAARKAAKKAKRREQKAEGKATSSV